MAENKKSFLLYANIIEVVSKLPDDKAGQLFKHILEYVNDLNPKTEDLMIELVFLPIKQRLKADLDIWEKKKIGYSKAGKASAEARKNKKESPEENNDLKAEKFNKFWDIYNKKQGKKKCLR